LALRSLFKTIRHFRNKGGLSALRDSIPDDPMLRLRKFAADERVERGAAGGGVTD